jgi:hypothetical protein
MYASFVAEIKGMHKHPIIFVWLGITLSYNTLGLCRLLLEVQVDGTSGLYHQA